MSTSRLPSSTSARRGTARPFTRALRRVDGPERAYAIAAEASAAPGRGGAPRMRGLGAGYTQILINGDPMPQGFALDQLSPSQIERIEVLRAPTAETGTRAIAGTNTITRTSGTEDLSTVTPPSGMRLDIDMIQNLTGALVGDVTVQVPAVSKLWLFRNNTTNGFFVYVKTSGGTAVQVPQGTSKWLYCDGTNVQRLDKEQIGDLVHSGCATVQSGTLQCNGASLLRSAYPDLFAKIGTTWGAVDGTHFTLPNYVTNNRFLRAAGGSLAVATTQASQNAAHTHTITGAPAVGTLTAQNAGGHTPAGTITNGTITFPSTRVATTAGGSATGFTFGPDNGVPINTTAYLGPVQAGSSFSGTAVPRNNLEMARMSEPKQ